MHMSNCSCNAFPEPKLLLEQFIYSLIEKLLIEVFMQSVLLDVNESTSKPETLHLFSLFLPL